MKIQSETKFLLKLLWDVVLLPLTFLQVLSGKQEKTILLKPFKNLWNFVWQPKFTALMIMLNVIIFFWSLTWPTEVFNTLLSFPSDLITFRFYSFITAGFLHAGLLHLFGNMLALFIFGRVVEQKLGFWKTAGVYFGALIISSVFTSFIHLFLIGDNIPGLGASGALMGIIATAILLNPFYLTYELLVPIPIMIVGWLSIYADIIGILNPAEDGIGHFAHLGGFISIAILAYFLSQEDKTKLKKGLLINIGSFVVLAGLVLFFR